MSTDTELERWRYKFRDVHVVARARPVHVGTLCPDKQRLFREYAQYISCFPYNTFHHGPL